MDTTFEKPIILNKKEREDKVLELLKVRDFVTKVEIADLLGWTLPKHDRSVRDIISDISHRYPIFSASNTNKGYKLLKDDADKELLFHKWAEIDKRREELKKSKQPLVDMANEKGWNTLFPS